MCLPCAVRKFQSSLNSSSLSISTWSFRLLKDFPLTPKVYIGIPRRCGMLKRRRRQIIKLLRMLGLGLVVVDPDLETG